MLNVEALFAAAAGDYENPASCCGGRWRPLGWRRTSQFLPHLPQLSALALLPILPHNAPRLPLSFPFCWPGYSRPAPAAAAAPAAAVSAAATAAVSAAAASAAIAWTLR